MPWLRHIYIVTNGQVPPWLDRAHPRLSIVSHETIFPHRQHLPCFNSHAIELHLHHIPNISRYFIYFNDDILLGNPVSPADFLTTDGVQTVYQDSWFLPANLHVGSEHDRAYAYTQALLNASVEPSWSRRALAHTPQLHDTDLMAELQQLWQPEIDETSSHPFRSPRDIAFEIMYSYYALEAQEHRARHHPVVLHSGSADYAFVMLDKRVPHMMELFENILFQKPKFICVNDDLDDSEEAEIVLEQCRAFLETYFPQASSFEQEID
jgi:hypothetical protein